VHFRHIPREQNETADWLTNVARQYGTHMDCTALCTDVRPFAEPPQQAKPNLVAPVVTRALAKRARTEEATSSAEVATSAEAHVPIVPGQPLHVDSDSDEESPPEAGTEAHGNGISCHKCSG
jgi:hypothetical protein